MVGLSLNQLSPETLHAGDSIQYYSRGFVCGDRRGLRNARILRIAQDADDDFPVHLDTDEPLPRTNIMKRVSDRLGNRFKETHALWRTLRSYKLVDGACEGPTRASILNADLRSAVANAFDAVRAQGQAASERNGPDVDQQVTRARESLRHEAAAEGLLLDPSTTITDLREDTSDESDAGDDDGRHACERLPNNAVAGTTADADDADDDAIAAATADATIAAVTTDTTLTAVAVVAANAADAAVAFDASVADVAASAELNRTYEPTEVKVQTANNEFLAIPRRAQRDKVRHQRKKRTGDWHVSKSRKKAYQKKRVTVRDSKYVYHAKSIKAKALKKFIQMPAVAARLKALRSTRPRYVDPDEAEQVVRVGEGIRLPEDEVKIITECRVPEGLILPDVGDFEKCECFGDCFRGSCHNAVAAIYCTKNSCNLKAKCSNAPKVLKTLRLLKTPITGIGVYTTTSLEAGDMVGEYAGQLCAYNALIEGQPEQTLKSNGGYTLLYGTKSTKKQYVYVEAVQCGTITRFINHACEPNVMFVEMRNRTHVKVIVIMQYAVDRGAEITVNYGNDKGFKCKCRDCM